MNYARIWQAVRTTLLIAAFLVAAGVESPRLWATHLVVLLTADTLMDISDGLEADRGAAAPGIVEVVCGFLAHMLPLLAVVSAFTARWWA